MPPLEHDDPLPPAHGQRHLEAGGGLTAGEAVQAATLAAVDSVRFHVGTRSEMGPGIQVQ